MANMSKDGNVQQQSNVQGQPRGEVATGVGSPISNEAYNVISALHAKLEGLEAYRKYSKDGGPQIWQQLTQIELDGVQKLVDELEKIVKDGKLRMQQPGKAH